MESKLFNDVLDEKLIDSVRTHPFLYQSSHESYKNNAVKENVWMEIASSLKKNVAECKTRWRTIRDSYKKNKNKIKNRRAITTGSAAFPKSKYNDDRLKFLDDSFKERVSKTTAEGSSTQEESDRGLTEDNRHEASLVKTETAGDMRVDSVDTEDNATKRNQPDVTKTDFKRHHSVSNPDSEPIRKKEKVHPTRDKLLDEIEKGREERDKILKKFFHENKQHDIAKHPIKTFFKSMATTVMTFPPHLITETRIQVCNIVSEMELRSLSEQHRQIPFHDQILRPRSNRAYESSNSSSSYVSTPTGSPSPNSDSTQNNHLEKFD